MSFIGNELIPGMTSVLDKAMATKILYEQRHDSPNKIQYNNGFYDGAMAVLKEFAHVIGNGECEVVFDGTFHDIVFRFGSTKEPVS